jgi:pilus assembly protein CpaB
VFTYSELTPKSNGPKVENSRPDQMFFILRRIGIASAVALTAVLLWVRRLDIGTANSHAATVPVIVAARDIPEGVALDRNAVATANWPDGTQPAGAYAGLDSVVGRVPRVPIFKGEAIVPGRLVPQGTGAGVDVKVTPGKRAYSIRINEVASLAGMLQPNSRVDIMVVTNDPRAAKRVAELFMSNVRVLAIGSVTERDERGRPARAATATVEVTPDEAERLAVAATQGELQLVLRGYADPDSAGVRFSSPMAVQPRATRDRMPVYTPASPRTLQLVRPSDAPPRFQVDSTRRRP